MQAHSQSNQTRDALATNPPQSLLLTGPFGIGLAATARAIASSGVIRHEVTPDASKAQPIITIEMIRELHTTSRTKSSGRQFIISHGADTMSPAAQASFLKLLEEPQPSIHYILLAHKPDSLLATIRSRTQQHSVTPLSRRQSEALLTALGVEDEGMRQKLLYLADGLPEELERLVHDPTYFEYRSTILRDSREFIQATSYKKLLVVQKYKDDRTASILLVDMALKQIRTTLSANPQPSLLEGLERLIAIRERLLANGNIRLQLLSFVV